jgi:predicted RNase H-like HicB family nuclease
MNRYPIVVEETETGFSAYSPDLPGCISTGATRSEVEANMREAVEFHIEGMRLARLPVPEPSNGQGYVELAYQIRQERGVASRRTSQPVAVFHARKTAIAPELRHERRQIREIDPVENLVPRSRIVPFPRLELLEKLDHPVGAKLACEFLHNPAQDPVRGFRRRSSHLGATSSSQVSGLARRTDSLSAKRRALRTMPSSVVSNT